MKDFIKACANFNNIKSLAVLMFFTYVFTYNWVICLIVGIIYILILIILYLYIIKNKIHE